MMRYCYHITMIDTYDRGWLEEYIGGDIENTSRSSNSILSDISAIIRQDDRLIFKLGKQDKEGNLYGIFDYRSGEVRRFKDSDSLRRELEPGSRCNSIRWKKPTTTIGTRQNRRRSNDEAET